MKKKVRLSEEIVKFLTPSPTQHYLTWKDQLDKEIMYSKKELKTCFLFTIKEVANKYNIDEKELKQDFQHLFKQSLLGMQNLRNVFISIVQHEADKYL